MLKRRSGLVGSIFLPHEVDIIRQIPLSHKSPEDKLMWYFHSKGVFTVQSAYLMELDNLRSSYGNISGDSLSSDCGRASDALIWKHHVPNKVKHFIWQAFKGILPTRAILAR